MKCPVLPRYDTLHADDGTFCTGKGKFVPRHVGVRNFLNMVFLITLPGNDRRDLKMGCIDVSRRQLQSVLKIGV